MVSSIDGLISGLGTSDLIAQLMQLERQPQNRLRTQQQGIERILTNYRGLNTKIAALGNLAADLTGVKSWQPAKATSSDATRVAISASPGASPGGMSFIVNRLATAASAISSGSVASGSTPVVDGPLFVTKGLAPLGIGSLTKGATLSSGTHTLAVTQASASATKTATTALAASTTVTGANNTLDISIDGGARTTITLTNGTYTQAQLTTALNTALTGSFGTAVNATLGADGKVSLATSAEGSGAQIQVFASKAVSALGLSTDAAALTGVDAKAALDGGASQTFTYLRAGSAVTLGTPGGDQLNLNLSGGLRVGEAKADYLDVPANATLDQLVESINKSSTGVTAASVQVSTGVFKLQLTSTSTGASSSLALGPFKPGTLGTMGELTAGQDAQLTVGSGANAYTVTRPSNTVSDLLTGVTMTLLKADPATTLTIDVKRDADSLADRVQKMVDSANSTLSDMKKLTGYNPETKEAGILIGDGMVRRLQSELTRTFTGAVAGSALGSPGAAGISVDRNGTITFDKAKFAAAYAKDPGAVEAVFGKGTTDANGDVVSPGLAGRLEAFKKRITDSVDGLIPASIKTREAEVRGFSERISSWDNRLELRERKLKNQFAAMETALGKMQQQSQWLAGQLAGLPQMGT